MTAAFIIEGDACTDWPATVAEFNRVFASCWKGHPWTGNFDSLNDLLTWINGGVGPCDIYWKHAAHARTSLGYPATAAWLSDKFHSAPVGSQAAKEWQKELTHAGKQKGPTLFARVLELMQAHEHLEVALG